jgi:hypothetical protein
MDRMTVIESKIGEMLTYLRQGLPLAKVDHRWSGMMHTFIIVRGGLIYQISLPESVITVRAQHELKRMVQPVLDRAQLGAAPRRVLVRSI